MKNHTQNIPNFDTYYDVPKGLKLIPPSALPVDIWRLYGEGDLLRMDRVGIDYEFNADVTYLSDIKLTLTPRKEDLFHLPKGVTLNEGEEGATIYNVKTKSGAAYDLAIHLGEESPWDWMLVDTSSGYTDKCYSDYIFSFEYEEVV